MNASMISPSFEQRVRERAYASGRARAARPAAMPSTGCVSEQATLAEIVTAPASKPAKPKAAPKKTARNAASRSPRRRGDHELKLRRAGIIEPGSAANALASSETDGPRRRP